MARSSLSNSLGSSSSGGAAITSSFGNPRNTQRHHLNSSLDNNVNNMFPINDEVSTLNMKSPADLNVFVDDLLQQMQNRFATMGDSIMGRMDAMGERIDALERNVTSLVEQAGIEKMTPSTSQHVHHHNSSSTAFATAATAASTKAATASTKSTTASTKAASTTTTTRRSQASSSAAVAAAAMSSSSSPRQLSSKQGSALTSMLMSTTMTTMNSSSSHSLPSSNSSTNKKINKETSPTPSVDSYVEI